MIQAVTFDVTHTLIHSPRLGEIYSAALKRLGVAVTPDEALRLVLVVWQVLVFSADSWRYRFCS
jgi:hypothetical protein